MIRIDGDSLSLEAVRDVARAGVQVELSADPEVLERIEESRRLKDSLIGGGVPIYGVTTGVGASVSRQVALDRAAEMQRNLVRKCGCGSGETLPADATRAAILIRANCLAKGNSGNATSCPRPTARPVEPRPSAADPGAGLAGGQRRSHPRLVHRSGTDRRAFPRAHDGEVLPAAEAWAAHDREPIRLDTKEGLSIINGTMVMSGVGVLAVLDAERLARLADVCGAMALEASGRHPEPVRSVLAAGQAAPGCRAARRHSCSTCSRGASLARDYQEVVDELEPMAAVGHRHLEVKIQDNYSVRCAPHCIGGPVRHPGVGSHVAGDRDQLLERQPAL